MRSVIARVLVVSTLWTAIAGTAGAQNLRPVREPVTPTNWVWVRSLAPGTEIDVDTHGERLGRRVFVAADDDQLTVLNLEHAALSAAAIRVLTDLATAHPEAFEGDELRGTFLTGTIRVGQDGVFDDGRKLLSIDRIVESYDREAVTALETNGLRYHHETARRMPKGLLWTGVSLLGYAGVLLRLAAYEKSGDNEFATAAGVFAAGGATLLAIGAARAHSRVPSVRVGRHSVAIQQSVGWPPFTRQGPPAAARPQE